MISPAVVMASLSISMAPTTDCSASMLCGMTRLMSASSTPEFLLCFFFYNNFQLSRYLWMQLNRNRMCSQCSDCFF